MAIASVFVIVGLLTVGLMTVGLMTMALFLTPSLLFMTLSLPVVPFVNVIVVPVIYKYNIEIRTFFDFLNHFKI